MVGKRKERKRSDESKNKEILEKERDEEWWKRGRRKSD